MVDNFEARVFFNTAIKRGEIGKQIETQLRLITQKAADLLDLPAAHGRALRTSHAKAATSTS